MSHFLNPDSDKKKSALTSTFSRFFLRRRDARVPAAAEPRRGDTIRRPPPRGMIVPLLRNSFFFLVEPSPCLRMGFLGVVPRLRRSLPATRKTRERSARERRARISFCVSVFSIRAARERGGFVFRERKKRSRGNTAPTGTLFAFGEKEDYFFFFPVDLKSFFTDATA